MRTVSTVQAMEHERAQWNTSVGFVPTMGYLHEGHLALCRHARAENELVVVSIFVNPMQFGPHEDLARYPRDIERDLRLLDNVGVDVVFLPSEMEIYPPGFTTYVDPTGPLAEEGEGAIRPGHFRGVATVVLKLFQIVRPQQAYFGQKDAQQVAVITRMVRDFILPVNLRLLPTIREADGLAMSSRNSYLDAESRVAATALYRALQAGRATFDTQMHSKTLLSERALRAHLNASKYDAHPAGGPQAVIQAMSDVIAREPRLKLEYAEVRDATTFQPLETLRAPALLLIAAHIGQTRLIDNFALHADGTWDSGATYSNE